VDDIFDIKESDVKWQQDEKRKSKFLFIGKNIVRENIEKYLKNSLKK
jgi:hypothetical protein